MLHSHKRSPRLSYICAGVAAVFSMAASAGLFGPSSDSALGVVSLGAIAAIAYGSRSLPRGTRWPWAGVSASLVLFLVAAALRAAYETMGNLSETRSLIPDLASGPGYLLLAASLGMVVRIRRRGVDGGLDAILDGCLAGLAALALAWVFLIEPAFDTVSAGVGIRMSIVAYPPLSVVLVVITCQLAFARGKRGTLSMFASVAAMAFLLVGDVFFTLVDANVANPPHFIAIVPYGLAHAAIIFMALHPSFSEFAEPLPADNTPASPARLAFVAVALAVPAMVSVTQHEMKGADRLMLSSIILVLTAVATWRVVRALKHHARSEKTLLYQATHDTLTGTLNRAGMTDELARLEARGVQHAVLFLDMDRFKLVNDSFGHSFGDDLLIAVADRLRSGPVKADAIARIGGDEFVVVIEYAGGLDSVVAAAEILRQSFGNPFHIRDTEIPVSFSVGIATSAEDGGPDALLRDADTAMYGAKDAGRDSVVVFDNSMRDRVSNRLELERDLRHALDRGELAVHYQPVIDMSTGVVQGFEALMRWNHPMRGTIPPLDFIPIAEETGLIVEIGAWILDEACRELSGWRRTEADGEDLWVSVNVSVRQLRDADFIFMMERSLTSHALDPSALVLEVTESMLLDEGPQVPAILNRIRDRGIRLSIDDFGTGYSSLAYLQRFPFHCVKIDRAFVEPLDAGTGSEHQLVGAIVAMAAALNLSTIAEGVETQAQADRLLELGCTTAQGYMYSRPVPADLIPGTLERLAASRRRPVTVSG